MLVLRRPSPIVFVLIYATVGGGLQLLVAFGHWPSVLTFLLIAGSMAAALWYPRWTQYTTIGLYALWLVPTVRPALPDAVAFWGFYILGTSFQVGLAEAIHQLVRRHARANERLMRLLTQSPTVLYELVPGPTGTARVSFVSANARVRLGIDPAQFMRAQHSAGLAGPTSQGGAWLDALVRDGERTIEYGVCPVAGRTRIVRDQARAICDESGALTAIVGQVLDVTEQRAADAALAESRRIQDEVVRHSPAVLFRAVFDAAGLEGWRYDYHSANTVDVLGYTADEVSSNTSLWSGQIHPDDLPHVVGAVRQAAAATPEGIAQTPVTVVYRFTRKDGTQIWIKESLRVRFDDQGRAVELFGQSLDITAEHTALDALRQAEARLRHIIEHSPMATYTLALKASPQPDLYCTFVSDNIAAITGFTAAELIDQQRIWGSRIHPDDRHKMWRPTLNPTHGRGPVLEYRFRHRDGTAIWLEDTAQAVWDEHGQLVEIVGQIQDITLRKRAQLEAEESHLFIAQLATAIPSQVFVADAVQPGFIYTNRPESDVIDYAQAGAEHLVPSVVIRRRVHPDDLSAYDTALAAMVSMADSEIRMLELRLQDRQGHWRDVVFRYRVFKRDGQDRPSQILAVWDDVSLSRQAQRERDTGQRLLSRVADAVPGVLYVLQLHRQSPDGGVIYTNRELPPLLGYPHNLVREQGWERFLREHLHPEDRPRFAGEFQKTTELVDGALLEHEYRLQAADQTWRWLRNRTMVFARDTGGAVSEVVGLIEDITASKALQDEVRSQRDFAQLVLNGLGQGVAVFDAEGRCAYINPAGARILETSADAFVGLSLSDVVPDGLRNAVGADWLRSLGDSSSLTHEIQVNTLQGRPVDLHITVTAHRRPGEDPGVLVIFSDITERKAMERDLAEALTRAQELTRAAQAATQAKSDFLANMSHEIRTPMNAIVGLAELLHDASLPDDQHTSVQMMLDSGQVLLQLIDDVLDFSKIEAGMLEIESRPFDLAAAIEKTTELVAIRARAKGLRLSCFIDPAVPLQMVGDSGRIRQILLNLLSNAVKFTSAGRVAVRAEVVSRTPEQVTVRLSVADTGIGIAPEAAAHLFQPFVQAESGITRRYGGTGLGLAIVRRLAELMDGAVTLDSTPDVGTTISVQLPLRCVENGLESASAPVGPQSLLLIEPDAVAGQILESYAQCEGFTSRLVATFDEALARLRVDPAVSAIVMGPTFEPIRTTAWARRLAQDPVLFRIRRAILVYPGTVVPDDVIRISWPLRRGALRDQLGQSPIRVVQDSIQAVPLVPKAVATRPCVVLAEDNPVNRKVATLQLEKLGWVIVAAENGAAARDLYLKDPEAVSLILMDCQMPVLDGLEATRQIRAWEQEQPGPRHVPILAMTANVATEDREACQAAGMDDFLSKPVQKAALEKALTPYASHATPERKVHSEEVALEERPLRT